MYSRNDLLLESLPACLSVCLCVCLAAGEGADADEAGPGQAGEAHPAQGD